MKLPLFGSPQNHIKIRSLNDFPGKLISEMFGQIHLILEILTGHLFWAGKKFGTFKVLGLGLKDICCANGIFWSNNKKKDSQLPNNNCPLKSSL